MKILKSFLDSLKNKENIVFITTSNRWGNEISKSTQLALKIASELKNIEVIDATKLKIYDCEGNVSTEKGNNCGVKESSVKGDYRCWVGINHKDDELIKIAEAIFKADYVIFFTSIRWGKANAIYSRLIERLTWLENRHSTLGESNLLKDKYSGLICIGQNFNGKEALELEKKVHQFMGFKIDSKLYFSWQFTTDAKDEKLSSYKKAVVDFNKEFDINKDFEKEVVVKFKQFFS